jgi:phytoene desaturase
MPSRTPHIVIIGAGPGGLTSGLLLAHRGCRVTILEKAPVPGGRNAEIKVGDCSFDLGPTFLHQKFGLDEIVAETGEKTDDLLDFVRLDPMTRLTWGEKTLHTYSDIERMSGELDRVFPGNSEGFRRYMRDHAKKFRTIYPCLQKPYEKLTSYLRPALLKAAPYIATTKTVHDVLGDYFNDDRLKLAFTFQAKYLGMSPWHCPALFSILSYTEYRYGVYHVQGGLNRISHMMAEQFQKRGGTLRLRTPVREVTFTGRTATGVTLENGEHLKADAVIMNADYGHAYTRLLGAHSESDEQMRRRRFSCSTFMLYLELDKLYPDEAHHHIVFADDYRANVNDIQSERRVSSDMSIYIRNSCVTDPHVAPAGKSGLYILVPTINTRHNYDWSTHREEYAQQVLARIEQHTGMKDLRSHITAQRIITPDDWQSLGPVFLGATFNLAHTFRQMLYFRPQNRARGLQRVFLAGGGTHPGSGLPTIYESGRITANLICDDFNVPYQTVDLASQYLAAA